MSSLPTTVDLVAYHGDTWTQTFRLKVDDAPVDLTGYTAACWAISQNRYRANTSTPLTVDVEPTEGEITISLPTEFGVGRYRYDLELTALNGEVTTWVRGDLIVEQDVTNA